MQADLAEAMTLYNAVKLAGGWEAEDVFVKDLRADGAGDSLQQAKRYRQHRAIERQPSHSRKVKQALGTRCMGCTFELTELYGEAAVGVIDAHHLVPLSALDDGEVVSFDPRKDFAVLCPNCHRVIQRLADPSDLSALQAAVRSRFRSVMSQERTSLGGTNSRPIYCPKLVPSPPSLYAGRRARAACDIT